MMMMMMMVMMKIYSQIFKQMREITDSRFSNKLFRSMVDLSVPFDSVVLTCVGFFSIIPGSIIPTEFKSIWLHVRSN